MRYISVINQVAAGRRLSTAGAAAEFGRSSGEARAKLGHSSAGRRERACGRAASARIVGSAARGRRWRIRLAAYGARLERVLGSRPRGFKSPILRQ